MPAFGDEPRSRHHFEVKNARFWRRESISSPSWAEKSTTLPTSVHCKTNSHEIR
ncbi:hypothetical protein LIZ76_17460 [Caldibacillus sp. 210928-DFI.2.22]|nr:hypothetical protein [Caldibacillus sp. 210928-DFI.2.22]